MTDFELLTQSTKRWADFKLTMRNRSIDENAKLRDQLDGTDLSLKWFMCMRRLYGDSAPAIYCYWRPSVIKHTADCDRLLQVDDISWKEFKKSQSTKAERLGLRPPALPFRDIACARLPNVDI